MVSELGSTYEQSLNRTGATSDLAIDSESRSGHVILASVAGAGWDTEMPFVVTVWSVSPHRISDRYENAHVANSTTALHETIEVHERILTGKVPGNQSYSGSNNSADYTRLDEKEDLA